MLFHSNSYFLHEYILFIFQFKLLHISTVIILHKIFVKIGIDFLDSE
jgi:hypothetical protein